MAAEDNKAMTSSMTLPMTLLTTKATGVRRRNDDTSSTSQNVLHRTRRLSLR